jgi:hypothetical protein
MQFLLLHFSCAHTNLNTYFSDMLKLSSFPLVYKCRNGTKQMSIWPAAELRISACKCLCFFIWNYFNRTEQLNRTLIRTWDHGQETSVESHLNGDTRDNPRFNWTREARNFNSLCWVRLVISETLSSALSRGMRCHRIRVGGCRHNATHNVERVATPLLATTFVSVNKRAWFVSRCLSDV